MIIYFFRIKYEIGLCELRFNKVVYFRVGVLCGVLYGDFSVGSILGGWGFGIG